MSLLKLTRLFLVVIFLHYEMGLMSISALFVCSYGKEMLKFVGNVYAFLLINIIWRSGAVFVDYCTKLGICNQV